jgi:hypothetical protein
MQTDRFISVISRALKDNAPSILSGIAITGVIGTAVLAVRATPKALAELEVLEDVDPPTVKEKVAVTWKLYIPAALTGAATIACIVGVNAIGARRNVALVGAYTLVDTAFRDYKEKVLEEIGPNKEQKVREAVAQERIESNPASTAQVLITRGGEMLCFDSFTGRYFMSDIEAIRKAMNDVNASIFANMYAPHNEFYELLGLEQVVVGDEVGWSIDNRMELTFSSHLSDDGRPCLAVNYVRLPRADYGKY